MRISITEGAYAALAAKFIAVAASPPAGRQIIKDYGKDRYGEGLYSDAAYARQYELWPCRPRLNRLYWRGLLRGGAAYPPLNQIT